MKLGLGLSLPSIATLNKGVGASLGYLFLRGKTTEGGFVVLRGKTDSGTYINLQGLKP